EARLMQTPLLHVRRQTCAWAPALNVADDQGDLGHRRPTDRFRLKRNAPARTARYCEIVCATTTQRDPDGRPLVPSLHENPSVLWQFAPERFHDGRPRSDRVTGAKAHAARDK